MIKTQSDFDNACNFIDSDIELYDFQLSEKMSSYEYNLYLQDTEYFLNFLYEKIRTLEELCDYLDHYIDVTIADARKKVDRDIAALRYALCAENSEKTQQHSLSWNPMQSQNLVDRDGTLLAAATYDIDIVPASCIASKTQATLLEKPSNNEAYKDNINTALRDGYYLATYQKGTNEIVTDVLNAVIPDDTEYNCITIMPINCMLSTEPIETGVQITMRPIGYDKMRRNFASQYDTGSILNQFGKDSISYDAMQTIHDNYDIWQNDHLQSWKEQCIDNIWKFQRIQKQKQDKANITGNL